MILLGAIANAGAVLVGTLIGSLLRNIPESMKNTVMQAIDLAIIVLGVQMSLKSETFLIVILSLVLGTVLGEHYRLEDKLNRAGGWLERKIGAAEQGSVAQGFITATLVFVVGAMGIIGALDSGIRGNHEVLFMKAVMDGFIAIILTSTLGIGVLFSALPILLYEGIIALLARQINLLLPSILMDQLILEMAATGGILVMAIGANLIGITKIKVGNMLPALAVSCILTAGYYLYQIL